MPSERLAKRIIACLDVDAGRVVKGVNFVNLRDAGDPVEVVDAFLLGNDGVAVEVRTALLELGEVLDAAQRALRAEQPLLAHAA